MITGLAKIIHCRTRSQFENHKTMIAACAIYSKQLMMAIDAFRLDNGNASTAYKYCIESMPNEANTKIKNIDTLTILFDSIPMPKINKPNDKPLPMPDIKYGYRRPLISNTNLDRINPTNRKNTEKK